MLFRTIWFEKVIPLNSHKPSVLPPLHGLRVVDLSRYIAGPLCAMTLGDLGADVVKVEKPDGDDVRALPPFHNGESLYFLNFNRSKRGVSIDLRSDKGQEALRQLCRTADVLIENFRPGTMEKMGCGWKDLHRLNPRLIMARISGFGQDGPLAHRPAFDQIAQAMSGLMQMTGHQDGPPTVAGTFIVDYSSALYATVGILSALRQRDLNGEGQLVDVALLDCASSLLTTAIPQYAHLQKQMSRNGNRDRYGSPENAYPSSDGWVFLAAGTDGLFPRLAAALEMPELVDDPRFASAEKRVHVADVLDQIVETWTRSRSAAEIVEAMDLAGIPCAKVATIKDVYDNPQLRHRGQIVEIEHPTFGSFRMHGLPIKFSNYTPDKFRPAPSIGQHEAEIAHDWLSSSPANRRDN